MKQIESVIKKIFDGKKGTTENDSENLDIHNEFVKFSRGTFMNKYLLEVKKAKSGNKYTIKTSAEYTNFLVKKVLGEINPEEKILMKGIIVSTRKDLPEIIKFPIEKIKQFAGVRQAIINTEVSPSEIFDLMKTLPKAFFALSFKTEDHLLKVKAKPPTSGKPGSKGEKKPKADFCNLKTTDKSFVNDLFFDNTNFQTAANVQHTIEVEDIIIPSGESDPIKMRENALRKGTIIRHAEYDEKQLENKKTSFEA